jgi:hypothetical protein
MKIGEILDVHWVKTTRYRVVLGQNANKTMIMHYHWENLDFTLGKTKNHVILRGFWSKCKKLLKFTILGKILGIYTG